MIEWSTFRDVLDYFWIFVLWEHCLTELSEQYWCSGVCSILMTLLLFGVIQSKILTKLINTYLACMNWIGWMCAFLWHVPQSSSVESLYWGTCRCAACRANLCLDSDAFYRSSQPVSMTPILGSRTVQVPKFRRGGNARKCNGGYILEAGFGCAVAIRFRDGRLSGLDVVLV